MNAAAIGLLSLLFAADPQVDPAVLIERALPLLEKQATSWVEARKCASCHHVPMMIWTHREAKHRGFAVPEEAVQDLETRMVEEYLAHPALTPTGQDQGYMEKPLGYGTIYLALGLQAGESPPVQTLERLRDNFLKHQNENGSWTTKIDNEPITDGHDCSTMLILLGLAPDSSAWQRGLAWLKSVPVRPETQSLALRALVAHRSGDHAEAQRYLAMLLSRQQANGGWSQSDSLACDALATGQALVAIGTIGGSPAAVEQARKFLADSQRPDGSWLVLSRNKTMKDHAVISYFGTAWAVLGLLETMPER